MGAGEEVSVAVGAGEGTSVDVGGIIVSELRLQPARISLARRTKRRARKISLYMVMMI
jgi:hypothetical protein